MAELDAVEKALVERRKAEVRESDVLGYLSYSGSTLSSIGGDPL